MCKGCDPEVPSNTPSSNPVPSLNMPSSEVAPTSKVPSSKAASPAPLHEVDFDMLDSSALIRDEADHKYLYSLSELEQEAIFHRQFKLLKSHQDTERALKHAVHFNRQFQRIQIPAGADKAIGGTTIAV